MLRTVVIGLIRLYRRAISPWTPAACRFHPTCSAYALEAVERYGAVRGSVLAARRLLRCHPWGGSGYDPVPPGDAAEVAGPAGEERAGTRDDGEGTEGPADEARKTKAMPNP